MRYMGGKAKLAKTIVEEIFKYDTKGWNRFIEPFLGGCNIVGHLPRGFNGQVICSDANAALISLYDAIIKGWIPPTEVSRETYEKARTLDDANPMKAFCGFGCSFAGKWFGGYASSETRNYAKNCVNSLARKTPAILRIDTLRCCNYNAIEIGVGDIVYCDPPYAGTTGYGAVPLFDSKEFWQWCVNSTNAGATIFVSEYACPVKHTVIWEQDKTTTVSLDKSKYKTAKEQLFLISI